MENVYIWWRHHDKYPAQQKSYLSLQKDQPWLYVYQKLHNWLLMKGVPYHIFKGGLAGYENIVSILGTLRPLV